MLQAKSNSLMLFFALVLIGLSSSAIAQTTNDHEVGLWIGAGTYFGDLNPDYNPKKTRPAVGGVYRYNANKYIALKGMFSATHIEYSDADSKNPYQQARNLNFRSNIFEASGMVELHFFKFDPMSPRGKNKFTPYISAGLALFHFNPRTKYDDQWYNLQEIGTEGQANEDFTGRKRYKKIQFAVPLGFGFKKYMAKNWSFFAEGVYRQTFTDYLDDVSTTYLDPFYLGDGTVTSALADRSGEDGGPWIGDEGKQRGDITNNDSYFMLHVGLTYTIFKRRCPKAK